MVDSRSYKFINYFIEKKKSIQEGQNTIARKYTPNP